MTRTTQVKFPAYQWYPKDWLSSWRVMNLTPRERDAYHTLLNRAWLEENQGYLPDDDDVLKNMVRWNDKDGPGEWENVRKMFSQDTKKSPIYNERQIVELDKQKSFRESRVEAGRKGGKASSTSKAKAQLEQSSTTAQAIPSTREAKSKEQYAISNMQTGKEIEGSVELSWSCCPEDDWQCPGFCELWHMSIWRGQHARPKAYATWQTLTSKEMLLCVPAAKAQREYWLEQEFKVYLANWLSDKRFNDDYETKKQSVADQPILNADSTTTPMKTMQKYNRIKEHLPDIKCEYGVGIHMDEKTCVLPARHIRWWNPINRRFHQKSCLMTVDGFREVYALCNEHESAGLEWRPGQGTITEKAYV